MVGVSFHDDAGEAIHSAATAVVDRRASPPTQPHRLLDRSGRAQPAGRVPPGGSSRRALQRRQWRVGHHRVQGPVEALDRELERSRGCLRRNGSRGDPHHHASPAARRTRCASSPRTRRSPPGRSREPGAPTIRVGEVLTSTLRASRRDGLTPRFAYGWHVAPELVSASRRCRTDHPGEGVLHRRRQLHRGTSKHGDNRGSGLLPRPTPESTASPVGGSALNGVGGPLLDLGRLGV